MLPLLLAAAVAGVPAEAGPAAAPKRQAFATVQIVRAAEIRFGQPAVRNGESVTRTAMIRDIGGGSRDATLVEFF